MVDQNDSIFDLGSDVVSRDVIEVASDATVEELKCLIAIESTIDPEK